MTIAHQPGALAEARAWTEIDEARLVLYHVLSLVASDPASQRSARLSVPGLLERAAAAAALLARDAAARPESLAPGELPPASLADFALTRFLAAPQDELRAQHERVFGLVVSKECPPYETDWCPQTFSVFRSQQLADVAGFYRAFGLQPSRDAPERPDHVALELEFMAWLLAKECHALQAGGPEAAERAATCREAQRHFVRDHLAWWLPAFALALRRKADGLRDARELHEPPRSALGALGAALAALVAVERALLELPAPTGRLEPRPAQEEEPGCASCAAALEESGARSAKVG
ncbi:MAG TPA: molecular chaperone TorD family protein [Planctomycetota bacterium]|nr:molecular chaperone TorD family protein [Planctomycetota bacterium]